MYQRGEVHNKPTGFWGMIKSVTTSVAGSESILHLHAGTCLGRWHQLSSVLKGRMFVSWASYKAFVFQHVSSKKQKV